MTHQPLAAVVLAAGQGKRMGADVPKVLVPACGRPLVEWVLDALAPLAPERTVIVHGHGGELVQEALSDRGFAFAHQSEQKGTGHAVQCALPALEGFEGDLLVLCGDTPLLSAEVLEALMGDHRAAGRALTVLSAEIAEPGSLGRVLRDGSGQLAAIREVADATPDELAVNEVNTGVVILDAALAKGALARLGSDNAQGEFYLTDVPRLLLLDGLKVDAFRTSDETASTGVNNRDDLAAAEAILRQRKSEE